MKKYLDKRTTQKVVRGLSKLIIFFLLASFLAPLLANAAVIKIDNPLEVDTFWDLIDKLIDFIFYLAIPIAAIMFIIAGFYFVIAAGDPNKITFAKQMIFWTTVGLFIVFLAKAFIVLFTEIFGIQIKFP